MRINIVLINKNIFLSIFLLKKQINKLTYAMFSIYHELNWK